MSETDNTKIREKIKLPFQSRPGDAGEWAYDHRAGLCVTVIVYLLAAIVFVSSKISLGEKYTHEGFYIDLADQLPEPKKAIERTATTNDDFSQIRNRVSNQNAEESERSNAGLQDNRSSQANEIYNQAEAAEKRLAANREQYEKGLRREQEINQTSRNTTTQSSRSDTKAKGRVTVEFSLTKPMRSSVDLVVPAYLCEGGGEIVINITVSRNGRVIAATPSKASSSVDECMVSTAVNSALQSQFNVEGSAPDKHTGTITYIFISQYSR